MTGSRRSKFVAVILFSLLAVVVVGVIGWATDATFELAKHNVLEERNRQVSEAMLRMDGYINGILNAETAREYTQYRSRYMAEAVAVFSPEGVELDADVLLASPLSKAAPQHDWIDLYFQVDPEGVASSPQVPLEGTLFLSDRARIIAGCDPRVCRTWYWLTTKVLPTADLAELVTKATSSDERPGMDDRDTNEEAARALGALVRDATLAKPGAPTGRPRSNESGGALSDYLRRKLSYRDSQATHVPPRECVAQHIAERNIRIGADGVVRSFEPPTWPGADVEVKTGKFVEPFWLEPQPDESPKLAFIRQCFQDETVFYQGFIGDWTRLKTALLGEIDYLYTDARLEPLDLDEKADSKLAHLPARLVVPEIPGGAAMAAWRNVRGTLIATWLAATAVLLVAGLGLRNLVSLTERRMQFAYAVTHELRTPLTTFRLYSDLLSAGMVPEESKPEYLDTLNRESQRLSNLVEDVLEYARVENHRVRLNVVETDAQSLLRVLAESHAKRCADHGIAAQLEDAMTNGQPIETDVDVVNRIAGILVNNACRHAKGRDKASIVMRVGAENGHVHLDVIDNGPGIDRGDSRSIFKPFRRGKRADITAQGGIGLGLALARNWAKLLGGRLDLVARHDPQFGGAHFRLTIPSKMRI